MTSLSYEVKLRQRWREFQYLMGRAMDMENTKRCSIMQNQHCQLRKQTERQLVNRLQKQCALNQIQHSLRLNLHDLFMGIYHLIT